MLAPDSDRSEKFSREVVRSLLSFIHTKNEDVVNNPAYSKLLDLVNDFGDIKTFKEQCDVCLLALINAENAVELLASAERHRLDALKRGAIEFICDNYQTIILPGQNKKTLEKLSQQTLAELIKKIVLERP